MAMLIKMVVITLILNIFIYVGLNMVSSLPDSNGLTYRANDKFLFQFKGDLISKIMGEGVMDKIANDTNLGFISYDVKLNGSLWQEPSKVAGGIGGLTSFIDVIDTVWSTVGLIWNIALSPLILFFNYRLPVLIGLMIGLPYAVMFVLGIIFFIRGMPS